MVYITDLWNVLEAADDDFLIAGRVGLEAPQVHAKWQRHLWNMLGYIRRRRIRKSAKDTGGCPDWLKTIHNGTYNAGGCPYNANRYIATTLANGKQVFHRADTAVSGRWVESEVCVTTAGIVPFRELSIDFVLTIATDSSGWPVWEQTQNGRFIHVGDIAFDLPLIGTKAHFIVAEHFSSRPDRTVLCDLQV
jgi:hypothetical protein